MSWTNKKFCTLRAFDTKKTILRWEFLKKKLKKKDKRKHTLDQENDQEKRKILD